jgi:hypothetical protein
MILYLKVLLSVISSSEYLFIQGFQFMMLWMFVKQAGQNYFGADMNVALCSASHRQGTTTSQLFFAFSGLVFRICCIVSKNMSS